MERIMSSEEKIRRAEEIYARRHEGNVRPTTNIKVSDKNNPKLLKKMILQIVACLCIYLIIYTIHNNNYIFSKDFINKANEILNYDTNFIEIYEKAKSFVLDFGKNNINEIIPPQEVNEENGIGGSAEEKQEEPKIEEVSDDENSQSSEKVVLSQEEQDIVNVKNTTTFIKPISRNYKFKIWTKRAYNKYSS